MIKYPKIALYLILLSIFGIVVIFYWINKENNTRQNDQIIYQMKESGLKNKLLNNDKFLLPEPLYLGSSQISLPPELQVLLIKDVKANIVSATYGKNSAGYQISMDNVAYPVESIVGTYSLLVKNNSGWKNEYVSYTDTFAVINTKNSHYGVQVIADQVAKNLFNIKINIINI